MFFIFIIIFVYFPRVTERRKCADCLGRLYRFWPIRVMEWGGRCRKPLRIENFKWAVRMVQNVKVIGYYICKVSVWVVTVGKWKMKGDKLWMSPPAHQHMHPGKKILARGLAVREVIKLELHPQQHEGGGWFLLMLVIEDYSPFLKGKEAQRHSPRMD